MFILFILYNINIDINIYKLYNIYMLYMLYMLVKLYNLLNVYNLNTKRSMTHDKNTIRKSLQGERINRL